MEKLDAHAARADRAMKTSGGGELATGAPASQCSLDHETDTQWTIASYPSRLCVARRYVPTVPLLDAPSTRRDSGSGRRDEALRLIDGDGTL